MNHQDEQKTMDGQAHRTERLALIFGGRSTEHEVSLLSAHTMGAALEAAGFEVAYVGITREGAFVPVPEGLKALREGDWAKQNAAISSPTGQLRDWFFTLTAGPVACVVNAGHGNDMEDGNLQGLFRLCDLPFTGAGVLASSMAMDKDITKRMARSAGVPVLTDIVVSRQEIAEDEKQLCERLGKELSFPLFLKPANGGSSVGTKAVHTKEELPAALREVALYDEKILAEPFFAAREIEVAVLGNDQLLVAQPGEVVKRADVEYYDYRTKYEDASSSWLEWPADIPEVLAEKIKGYAKTIYKTLGIEGYARVDFFVKGEEIYLNEINSLPGFTEISLFPRAMGQEGLDLPSLMTRLVELAMQAYEKDRHERQKDR